MGLAWLWELKKISHQRAKGAVAAADKEELAR